MEEIDENTGTNEQVFTQRFAIRGLGLGGRYLRLGDWLLENRYRVPALTTQDAFEEIGMYRHDCVGFAKKLGFSGWKEMKLSLYEETIERLRYLDTEEGMAEAAKKLYRNVKRKRVNYGCAHCGSDMIFRAKGGWYLFFGAGLSEIKVNYCPICGHKLSARDKTIKK